MKKVELFVRCKEKKEEVILIKEYKLNHIYYSTNHKCTIWKLFRCEGTEYADFYVKSSIKFIEANYNKIIEISKEFEVVLKIILLDTQPSIQSDFIELTGEHLQLIYGCNINIDFVSYL